MQLSPEKKIAGILAPLFGLRGEDDLGIGDVAVLREFVDWAAEIGFKLVQLLPINETGNDNSPYNAISAIAIEPTTLHLAPGSPAELTREDYEAALRDVDLEKLRHGSVKYGAVKKLKRRLLEKAFANFSANAAQGRQMKFREFCERESTWLNNYALFRALIEENGESEAWDKWPSDQQNVESARAWLDRQTADNKNEFQKREQFFRYVQWIAHEQWSEIKSYAESRGVALMGDIPFGVNYYSADVFTRPGEFALDWCGGAPPETHFKDDKFTQKWGQNWGIPLYRWDAMRQKNFDWWRQRVRAICRSFQIFRIDHVLGFYRVYAFPWRPQQNKKFLELDWNQMLEKTGGRAPHFHPRDDSTSENCEANQRDGEEYLRVVLEESGNARVVGEDLGTVPNYVRPSLRSLGIAGFKIPQWEVYHGRVTPGREYERLSVATYCTHDHPPLRAMWEDAFHGEGAVGEQARFDLEKVASFADFKRTGEEIDFERDFYPAAMRALFKSESWIAMVMITDLLARKYRFNVPGTAGGSNWTRRMQRSVSQLRSSPREKKRMQLIRDMLNETGRT
ncbi:MAG TPA: 4-alpha-glucanotransferase [Chthoniobacterales bacterium]|jgi:4-alpha-glucanotransferase|nr:4-alpha-glucanotransferase [Chthoniobacterales bacterium]